MSVLELNLERWRGFYWFFDERRRARLVCAILNILSTINVIHLALEARMIQSQRWALWQLSSQRQRAILWARGNTSRGTSQLDTRHFATQFQTVEEVEQERRKERKLIFHNDSMAVRKYSWLGRMSVFQWWSSACGGIYLTLTSESALPLVERAAMSGSIIAAATAILIGVSAINSRRITQIALETTMPKKTKGTKANKRINKPNAKETLQIKTLGLMAGSKEVEYDTSMIKKDLSQWRLDSQAAPNIRLLHIEGEKSFQCDLAGHSVLDMTTIRRLVDPRTM